MWRSSFCFRKNNERGLYRHNCKTWMIKCLFKEGVLNFDNKMQKINKKVLLILENISLHMSFVHLKCNKLLFFFLPSNTTFKVQPLDQRITPFLKLNTRRKL